MSTIKYPNGMYKNTSKIQDRLAFNLYNEFQMQWHEFFTGMSMLFDQTFGVCTYTYTFANGIMIIADVLMLDDELLESLLEE